MKKPLQVTGIKEAMKNLDKIERYIVETALDKALQDLGDKIGDFTQGKVPVGIGKTRTFNGKEGEYTGLKGSFTVQKIKGEWYAGYNVEHAAYQHEGVWPDGTHKKQNFPGGGELYFLSGPVKKNEKVLLEFFAERFEFYFNQVKLSL